MKERLFPSDAPTPTRRHADTFPPAPIRRYISPAAGTFLLLSLFFLLPIACFSQRLTPLSHTPHWDQLNRFQENVSACRRGAYG